jgi:bifunctional non-homologous end joining protein LigD
VRLVYYAFDLLHLDGQDISGLQLVERKALLEPLVAGKPGLQFNGHETGDAELILKHAGKLVLRAWCQRRSTPLTCQETAAYGAKLNG